MLQYGSGWVRGKNGKWSVNTPKQPITQPESSVNAGNTVIGEWMRVTDEDGDTFWKNTKTGELSWELPEGNSSNLQDVVSSNWEQIYTYDGKKFWKNKRTGEVSTQAPVISPQTPQTPVISPQTPQTPVISPQPMRVSFSPNKNRTVLRQHNTPLVATPLFATPLVATPLSSNNSNPNTTGYKQNITKNTTGTNLVEKPRNFNNKQNAFYISGHGYQVVGEDKQQVPDGCTFVLKGKYGEVTYTSMSRDYLELFKKIDIQLFKDPYSNYSKLEKFFNSYYSKESIHSLAIYSSNTKYDDVGYFLINMHTDEDKRTVIFSPGSGIINLTNNPDLHNYINSKSELKWIEVNEDASCTRDDFLGFFRFCFYPSQNDLRKAFDTIVSKLRRWPTYKEVHDITNNHDTDLGKLLQIRQSQIFKKVKDGIFEHGVYYNPVCRFINTRLETEGFTGAVFHKTQRSIPDSSSTISELDVFKKRLGEREQRSLAYKSQYASNTRNTRKSELNNYIQELQKQLDELETNKTEKIKHFDELIERQQVNMNHNKEWKEKEEKRTEPNKDGLKIALENLEKIKQNIITLSEQKSEWVTYYNKEITYVNKQLQPLVRELSAISTPNAANSIVVSPGQLNAWKAAKTETSLWALRKTIRNAAAKTNANVDRILKNIDTATKNRLKAELREYIQGGNNARKFGTLGMMKKKGGTRKNKRKNRSTRKHDRVV